VFCLLGLRREVLVGASRREKCESNRPSLRDSIRLYGYPALKRRANLDRAPPGLTLWPNSGAFAIRPSFR